MCALQNWGAAILVLILLLLRPGAVSFKLLFSLLFLIMKLGTCCSILSHDFHTYGVLSLPAPASLLAFSLPLRQRVMSFLLFAFSRAHSFASNLCMHRRSVRVR